MLLGVTSPTKLLEVQYNMAIIKYLWNNNFPSNMKFIEENNIYMKNPKNQNTIVIFGFTNNSYTYILPRVLKYVCARVLTQDYGWDIIKNLC